MCDDSIHRLGVGLKCDRLLVCSTRKAFFMRPTESTGGSSVYQHLEFVATRTAASFAPVLAANDVVSDAFFCLGESEHATSLSARRMYMGTWVCITTTLTLEKIGIIRVWSAQNVTGNNSCFTLRIGVTHVDHTRSLKA